MTSINKTHMHISGWVVALALCVNALGQEPRNPVVAEVSGRVHHDSRPLVLPVTLEFGEGLFIIDTGASITVVDSILLPFMAVAADKAGAEPRVVSNNVRVRAGSIDITLPRFVAMDLSHIRNAQDMQILGILGMDFLRHLCLVIDSDNGTFSLSREMPRTALPSECAITLVEGSRPFVAASVDDAAIPILIDTGAMDGVCVAALEFDNTFKDASMVYMPESYATAGAVIEGRWLARSSKVCLGPVILENLFVERNQKGKGSHIGRLFLCRLNICMNFPDRKLYFGPSRLFKAEDCADRSGVMLSASGSLVNGRQAYAVAFVRNGSSGQAAGLKPGDLIYEIDWKDVCRFEGVAIYRGLSIPRVAPFTVYVSRDGDSMQCRLPAKD